MKRQASGCTSTNSDKGLTGPRTARRLLNSCEERRICGTKGCYLLVSQSYFSKREKRGYETKIRNVEVRGDVNNEIMSCSTTDTDAEAFPHI